MGGCLPEYETSENAVPGPRPFVPLCKACLVLLELWVIYLNAGSSQSCPAPFGKGARGEEAVTASEKLKLSLKMTVRNENEKWKWEEASPVVDDGVSPPLSDSVQDSSLLPELPTCSTRTWIQNGPLKPWGIWLGSASSGILWFLPPQGNAQSPPLERLTIEFFLERFSWQTFAEQGSIPVPFPACPNLPYFLTGSATPGGCPFFPESRCPFPCPWHCPVPSLLSLVQSTWSAFGLWLPFGVLP